MKMAYIIENANLLKNNQLNSCSLLIKENEIAEVKPSFARYKFMRMNVSAFIMTPTYCLFDPSIPISGSSREFEEYITENFLKKGSTAILTCVNIQTEYDIPKKMKEMKNYMNNSPVDFLIAIKIPLRLLTQTLIRVCKKEKISAIIVDINQAEELDLVPWGWLKEALFPYHSTLIPSISSDNKKDSLKVLSKWKLIVEKEKLPAITETLETLKPLPVHVLNKIGIFPYRASLMHGTELSYNLYIQDRDNQNVSDIDLFLESNERLAITVHKGEIIRTGNDVLFKPGNGEYVKVRTPAFFSL